MADNSKMVAMHRKHEMERHDTAGRHQKAHHELAMRHAEERSKMNQRHEQEMGGDAGTPAGIGETAPNPNAPSGAPAAPAMQGAA